MKTFKQYLISEASIRQGLPHITTMDHDQFHGLIGSGKVHIKHMTEKTDGQTHVMGYDHEGFYTQSSGSGSEKMREPGDYHARAKRRSEETGKPYDSTAPDAFAHIHKVLQSNKKLQQHLKDVHEGTGQEVKVRGETFYKPWGRPSEEHPGEVKFVGTSYATHHMGKVGKYVIHTKLPENQHHDVEHFKKNLSSEDMNFDDDTLHHPHGREGSHIDVSKEKADFDSLDHDLIKSRTTPKNKEAKLEEIARMNHIQKRVSDKVDAHVKSLNLKPKWGSGSEGIVVHPHGEQPRFKVTSDAFRSFKASDESKNLIKKRETNNENV